MTIPLPDGWTVEIEGTSTGFPPDDPSGLSLNCSACFVRLRGSWDSGWHEATRKSPGWVRDWWLLVESKADIKEAWLGSVGGVWPPPRYDETWKQGVSWLEGA